MAVKHQYAKAAWSSFFFHALLLGLCLLAGHFFTQPISAAIPIEVELLAAHQTDIGFSQNEIAKEHAMSIEKALPTAFGQPSGVNTQEFSAVQNSIQDADIHDGPISKAPLSCTVAAGHNESEEAPLKRSAIRTQASCVASFKPAYPREAVASGWEGSVIVHVLIGKDGSPNSVTVKGSSGYSILDEAAVRAVKKWRFSPARQGDTPIESYYDVRVRFSLDEADT